MSTPTIQLDGTPTPRHIAKVKRVRRAIAGWLVFSGFAIVMTLLHLLPHMQVL